MDKKTKERFEEIDIIIFKLDEKITTFIILVISIIIGISVFFILNSLTNYNFDESEINQTYYSNADTFCQYYNMSLNEYSLFMADSCYEIIDDVKIVHYLNFENNRYYFQEPVT